MASIRSWLKHRTRIAEFTGLILAAVLGLLLASIFGPTVGSETLEGRLLGWRMVETETGSKRMAQVQAGERIFTVRLPVRHACRLGERVVLRRSRLWWGGSLVTVASPPCPAESGATR